MCAKGSKGGICKTVECTKHKHCKQKYKCTRKGNCVIDPKYIPIGASTGIDDRMGNCFIIVYSFYFDTISFFFVKFQVKIVLV